MVADTDPSISLRLLGTFFNDGPDYAFYGHGKGRSCSNAVSLLTNSIRVEIRTILRVLKTMGTKPSLLTRAIVSEVYEWLHASVRLMDVSFNILLHEMMNVKCKGVDDMGGLSAAKRVLLIGQAQRTLQRMLETEDKFTVCLPAGEVFPVLAQVGGELRALEEVLSLVDRELAGHLARALGRKEGRKLERETLEMMAGKVGGATVEGVMTRWMTQKQTRRMMRRRARVLRRRRVFKMRALAAKEYGRVPGQIGRMMLEEEQARLDGQDVMDPEVQKMLNQMALPRLSKRFGRCEGEGWSEGESESEPESESDSE